MIFSYRSLTYEKRKSLHLNIETFVSSRKGIFVNRIGTGI